MTASPPLSEALARLRHDVEHPEPGPINEHPICKSYQPDLRALLAERDSLAALLAVYAGGDDEMHAHHEGSCHMCGYDFGQKARALLSKIAAHKGESDGRE